MKTLRLHQRMRAVPALCTLLLLTGCLGSLWPFGEKAHYTVAGVNEDLELQTYLQKIIDERTSGNYKDTGDPDAAAQRENYREKMIENALQKGLQARGYYDGKVTYEDDAQTPQTGTYHIDTGALYTIDTIDVGPGPWPMPPELAAGGTLDAAIVLRAQQDLYKLVQKDRCYYALTVNHEVMLDKITHTAAVHFKVHAAREATLGPAIFTGNTAVHDSYLKKLVPWRTGDCYNADKIETLRTKLLESGLFTRVEILLPDEPPADGEVPVVLRLEERAARTIRAGASFYSDEGLGLTLGWEHRNFFGNAEKLNADLTLSMLKQSLDIKLKKPFFIRKDQNLSLYTALSREDSDAYVETAFKTGAAIERQFTKKISGSTGIDLKLTRIEEKNLENEAASTYGLISFPQSLKYDSRDDKLDPHKGFSGNLKIAPFVDALGESDPFLRAEINGSTYFALADTPDIILALRGGIGSILGAGTFSIPSTERFFAGGSATVRGYGYQQVGPKDADNNPTGGRSRVNGTAEFRFKITPKYGAVTFVDVGSVSDSATPDFDQIAVGVGAGIRYYTDFGPLRFDFAVPASARDELEQTYQFYISIGQAF